MILTGDNAQLEHTLVGYLPSVAEGLAADAGVALESVLLTVRWR